MTKLEKINYCITELARLSNLIDGFKLSGYNVDSENKRLELLLSNLLELQK